MFFSGIKVTLALRNTSAFHNDLGVNFYDKVNKEVMLAIIKVPWLLQLIKHNTYYHCCY